MSILGDNTTPSSGNWTDSFGNSQWWIHNSFSMPAAGGTATDMNVYMAGFGGTVTIQMVLWDSGGNIFWQSGNMSVSGSEAWKQSTAINGLWIPGGNYFLGFWSSGNVQWQVLPSGTNGGTKADHSVGSPTTTGTGVDEYGGQGFGSFGAYISYTAGGGAYVMRSGSFGNAAQVEVERSGSMTPGVASVMRSSNGIGVWVRGG